jgi:hypothetical protein
MSDDQIIRTSKRHEVSIPEGSNNASSQKSVVGVHEPELSSESAQRVDHETSDHTVRVQEESLADRHISLAPDSADPDHQVMLPQEGDSTSHRALLPGDDPAAENRVQLPSDDPRSPDRVALPGGTPPQDNLWTLPADHRDGNTVKLEAGAVTSHTQSLTSQAHHDTHAELPDMTNTAGSHVSIEDERITDPQRVVVDDSHGDPPIVAVPAADSAHQAEDVLEGSQDEDAGAVASETQTMATTLSESPAQVSSHLSDKKAEEFRGRVVKLRDEVDQLNRRLDEIEKHEI